MIFELKTVRRTINKAFLKEPIERGSFTVFKDALEQFLNDVEIAKEKHEHEEHFKNFLVPFFNKVGFQDYSINTSGRIDMAIHTGGKGKDPVGVLIEAKRPGNSNEMITKDQINRKAMHEAVLYYLDQRIEQDNSDLKHVIITNMDEWFIFDAQEFERFFYRPSTLRKTWKEWKSDRKVSSNNDFMYTEISRYIDSQDSMITGLWLPLSKTKKFLKGEKDSEYEKKLIPIYKLFTPTQLLKEAFANDSNSLNKEFYRELLYILGLEETKEGSTRYIQRVSEENRNQGSVIENTIRILDVEDHLSTLKNSLSSYGKNREEQLFSVAMELSITWMNRVLFLKLLEAQLYRYHRQDKNFKFLNYKTIDGLDELNKLFFQVLARKEKERSEDINEKFGHIPYLNSSLFDVSSLERQTTRISGLDDHADMPVYSKSVLTKQRGKTLNALDYLFQFLEAYDFSAEGSEEIRDESKSLINASVLGLIFEKINGYKDGSFYTPGFITEYMARETLQKSVTDAFNKKYGWNCDSFDDLYNEIHRERVPLNEANEVINDLKICDPAVGSGHFLVSCLNELIAIKSRLDILCDSDGKLLRQIDVIVENDELIISWGDEELFEYDVSHSWKGTKLSSRSVSSDLERVQKTLFKEKRYLIENCLFGVDINPNSVKICRLRLWIELLKRAYYTPESNFMELEVLPNIDINIKQGNSLVSRFELDSDLSSVFKDSEHSLEDYKEAVRSYKHTGDRSEKQRLQQLIDDIKKEYTTTLTNNRPINQKISKARGKLQVMQSDDLFGEVKFTKKEIKKQEKKLKKLEEQKAEEVSGAFYNDAFEWRFEFPEVLNEEGEFTGFDVVIGNPPYGRYNMFTNEEKAYLKDKGKYGSTGDIAEVFINFVIEDLSNKYTQFSFIVPKGLSYVKSWSSIREKMLNETRIFSIIDTSNAFDEALYEMLIFHIDKNDNQSAKIKTGYLSDVTQELFYIPTSQYSKEIFYIGFPKEYFPILEKINDNSTSLSEHYDFWYGKGGMTPKINKNGKGIKVLTGKEIQRFFFKDIKNKWYLERTELDQDELKRSEKTKVVAQDIVAHVKNPKPHIKLTASIDKDKQFCLNTVMCFSEIKGNGLSNEFLVGLINSKLMSFYFYYFIFNQAIRTMHFMPGYADRLPIQNNSKSYVKVISDKVAEALKAKKQNPNADTNELESEIDRLIYELYGLSEEEIWVVEGGLK
jgi:hypothetical protein